MAMYDVFDDLSALYSDRGIRVSATYREIVGESLTGPLAYSTPLMYGLAETLFSSRALIAYNLLQNSIDEAKGAARISVIADRHASDPLIGKMRRHVAEEMKHSRQFLRLIELTGLSCHLAGDPQKVEAALDFDDDLGAFLCRVHSIEIRSWTMLRIYINLLEERADPSLSRATPVLAEILEDEISHVLYTGAYVSERLETDGTEFGGTLRRCLEHTNHETWRDIVTTAGYLAENYELALAS